MAGIKSVYRSIDTFRIPEFDSAISYSANSVVALYDSDYGAYRHYISSRQTTQGSLQDSEKAFTADWNFFSFDSDTLFKYSNETVLRNADLLTATLKDNIDSDLAIKFSNLKSELDSDVLLVRQDLDSDKEMFQAFVRDNDSEHQTILYRLDSEYRARKSFDSDLMSLILEYSSNHDSDLLVVLNADSEIKASFDSDVLSLRTSFQMLESDFNIYQNVFNDQYFTHSYEDQDSDILALKKTINQLAAEFVSVRRDHLILDARVDSDLPYLSNKIDTISTNLNAEIALVRAELDSDEANLAQRVSAAVSASATALVANVKSDNDSDFDTLSYQVNQAFASILQLKHGDVADNDSEISVLNTKFRDVDSDFSALNRRVDNNDSDVANVLIRTNNLDSDSLSTRNSINVLQSYFQTELTNNDSDINALNVKTNNLETRVSNVEQQSYPDSDWILNQVSGSGSSSGTSSSFDFRVTGRQASPTANSTRTIYQWGGWDSPEWNQTNILDVNITLLNENTGDFYLIHYKVIFRDSEDFGEVMYQNITKSTNSTWIHSVTPVTRYPNGNRYTNVRPTTDDPYTWWIFGSKY